MTVSLIFLTMTWEFLWYLLKYHESFSDISKNIMRVSLTSLKTIMTVSLTFSKNIMRVFSDISKNSNNSFYDMSENIMTVSLIFWQYHDSYVTFLKISWEFFLIFFKKYHDTFSDIFKTIVTVPLTFLKISWQFLWHF